MQTANSQIVDLLGNSFEKCESPSLRLEKFVNKTKGNQTERATELQFVINCYKAHHKTASLSPWKHPKECVFYALLQGNLIINQSGGILENAGLCLNRLHGYPCIPGSAVKGVASMAAFREWMEQQTEDLALRIVDVFGFPTGHLKLDDALRKWKGWTKEIAFAGKVSFLAAVPSKDCNLTLDIATPHHPEYYQGKRNVATDDEAPIPLAFPAVKAASPNEFTFRIIPLRNADNTILNDARKWLETAITLYGIGAKTAAGYGWFELGRDPELQRLQDLHDANEAKKKEKEEKQIEEEQQRQERAAKHAAAVAGAKAAEDAKKEELRKKPFAQCDSKNWRKFSADVSAIYKAFEETFSDERRQELYEVIRNNPNLKPKDLKGPVKTLIHWLGEDLQQKLFKEKGIS